MLVIPHRDSHVKCYVDKSDISAIQSSCAGLHVVEDKSHTVYVSTCVKGTPILLHRFLMRLRADDKRDVDHINGNTLDCRRGNMRIVDHQVNCQNRSGDSETGIRGVRGKNGRWVAEITVAGQRKHLGTFDAQYPAAMAVLRELLKVDLISAKRYALNLLLEFPLSERVALNNRRQLES
jgi:hypothetical protein